MPNPASRPSRETLRRNIYMSAEVDRALDRLARAECLSRSAMVGQLILRAERQRRANPAEDEARAV